MLCACATLSYELTRSAWNINSCVYFCRPDVVLHYCWCKSFSFCIFSMFSDMWNNGNIRRYVWCICLKTRFRVPIKRPRNIWSGIVFLSDLYTSETMFGGKTVWTDALYSSLVSENNWFIARTFTTFTTFTIYDIRWNISPFGRNNSMTLKYDWAWGTGL